VDCFPACAVCTGACKVPVQAVRLSKARRLPTAPNMRDPVRLECGCLADIIPMLRLFTRDVMCGRHGWQPIAAERKPRKRKGKPEIPGQEEMVPY
jgi:hypothetical protein